MMPLWRSATTTLRSGRPRVERIARIGGEAGLIAAVAFGVAQLAWRMLAPMPAMADIAPVAPDVTTPEQSLLTDISPFAPFATPVAGAQTQLQTAFNGVAIAGVRLAIPAERSSIVLSLPEGRQAALMVGQEFAGGITLTHVAADHAEFSYNGQRHDLVYVSSASRPSLARALMQGGPALEAIPLNAPSLSTAVAPAAIPAVAAVPVTPALANAPTQTDAEWLAATLSGLVTREGGDTAWRVAANPPRMLVDADVKPGDLILAVNGQKPGEGVMPALAGGPQARLSLTIETAAGARRELSVAMDAS
jgi:hypothetical protein